MTKEEAIAVLDRLGSGDIEDDHLKADGALLDYLRANGAEDVAAAYERARDRLRFWYA